MQAGVAPPPLRDYFERIMDFATQTEWGKRSVSRAELHGGAPEHPRRPHGARRRTRSDRRLAAVR